MIRLIPLFAGLIAVRPADETVFVLQLPITARCKARIGGYH